MLGQAVGYVSSKLGMQTKSGYIDAFDAAQIHATAGAFFAVFGIYLLMIK